MKVRVCLIQLALLMCSLEAEVNLNPAPTSVIEGRDSLLTRPDGVAFSPDNQCLAIANSTSHTITLHRRVDTGFETTPCTVIRGLDELKYPHDLAFTPDGSFLGVIARDSHTFLLFHYDPNHPGQIDPNPCFILKGKESSICFPSSLDFSPIDSTLIICNRMGSHGLTFYRHLGEGSFEKTPFYQITEEAFLEMDLASPDGFEINGSGTLLVSVHKRFNKNADATGSSGLAILELDRTSGQLKATSSFFEHTPHDNPYSSAFHPSQESFAMTYHKSKTLKLYQYHPKTNQWTSTQTLQFSDQNSRRKLSSDSRKPNGVAFSPDGSQLAVTVLGKHPQVLIYDCVESSASTT